MRSKLSFYFSKERFEKLRVGQNAVLIGLVETGCQIDNVVINQVVKIYCGRECNKHLIFSI